jgi:hypothetical protein
MSRQKTVTVYSYAELSANAQARAKADYEESLSHHNWDEPLIEGIEEEASQLGILDFELQYSGFWSQGDGLSFTGTLSEMLAESIYKEKINRDGWQSDNDSYVVFIKRKAYPHYVHEKMVYSQVFQNDEYRYDYEDIQIIEDAYNDWKDDLCNQWYGRLKEAYNEIFDEDNIVLALSKYEFYEDGRVAGVAPEPALPYAEYNVANLKLNDESSNKPLNVEINFSTTKKVIIHIDNICTLRLDRKSADQLAMSIKDAESNAEQVGVIPINQLV